jgi:integrase
MDGYLSPPVDRADRPGGEHSGEKVVRQYAEASGIPGIAPRDIRRTCAKLCRAAGGELEQIQLMLGHASVQTTERYLGTKQLFTRPTTRLVSRLRCNCAAASRPARRLDLARQPEARPRQEHSR